MVAREHRPVSNLEAEIDNPYDIQDFQQNPGLQFSVLTPDEN
jgi:hypothetical protein